jgi:hypothetical protein
MQRRRIILLAFLICGAAAMGLGLALRENTKANEEGERLKILIYRTFITPCGDNPIPPNWHEYELTAIREMGTNALPWLLKWLVYEPPKWEAKYGYKVRSAVDRLPRPLSIAGICLIGKEELPLNRIALQGFDIIGTNAAPAVPSLVRLLSHHPKADVYNRAMHALRMTGPAGVPPLMSMLADTRYPSEVRFTAACAIGWMEWNSVPAIWLLIQSLEDKDPWVVCGAAYALWKSGVDLDARQQEKVVPALGRVGSGLDISVRDYIEAAFKRLGSDSQPVQKQENTPGE